MAAFRVGLGQVDFTPSVSVPLQGNFRQDYMSRGVHDPLYARAFVIANGSESLGLLQVDLCKLDRTNAAMIRHYAAERTPLREEHILIAATHTHAGPMTAKHPTHPGCQPELLRSFLEKAASAMVQAYENLAPSELALGRCDESRVSFNRRLKCRDGETHMNWEKLDPDFVIEPLGPVDPELMTLTVLRARQPVGALINFALHPAVLAGDNYLISADFPGYLAEAMTRFYGKAFVPAFFNGPCGNVNHIDYRDLTQGRGYQMTQRIGYMLGAAAYEAMQTQRGMTDTTLAVSSEQVEVPRMRFREGYAKECQELLRDAQGKPSAGQEDGLPPEYFARLHLEMMAIQDVPDYLEVQVMRIGDTAVVGMPGEIFCELGLLIKKNSVAGHTIVIEQANDSCGYLPNREAFAAGGYEVNPGSTRYQSGAGETLVESALRQITKLFKA